MKDASSRARLGLAAIVVLYVLIAVQYARLTPPWQAPDEPAHFNYVKFVAEHRALPILQTGDYTYDYLEQIKSARFPANMSIDPIRYESWQPPLYYLLAAPLYAAASGGGWTIQLLVLRLFSVLLGALLLLVAYHAADEFAPGRHWLALGCAALIAALPMHIAMTAAANNDTLAELFVAAILWQLLRILRRPNASLASWLLVGLTLGLAALTKLSTLATTPLLLGVLAYDVWRNTPARRLAYLWRRFLASALPGLLLFAPWLAHNASIYGWRDPFVFRRHSEVVQGQLRTADWLRQNGLPGGLRQAVQDTFHSFWGQFGWMGVPIDERLYRLLAFLTFLAAIGLLFRLFRKTEWSPARRTATGLLLGSLLLTGASYLWYNLSFVQHQGRYLFPALIPLAIVAAIGWHELTRRDNRITLAVSMVLVAVVLAASALLHGHMPERLILAAPVGLGALSLLAARLPERWGRWLYAVPYPALLLLDLLCLYRFILPALA
jgi:4-amino-4-deoxy-L-arabinose transferase-like glycosyltransferase